MIKSFIKFNESLDGNLYNSVSYYEYSSFLRSREGDWFTKSEYKKILEVITNCDPLIETDNEYHYDITIRHDYMRLSYDYMGEVMMITKLEDEWFTVKLISGNGTGDDDHFICDQWDSLVSCIEKEFPKAILHKYKLIASAHVKRTYKIK